MTDWKTAVIPGLIVSGMTAIGMSLIQMDKDVTMLQTQVAITQSTLLEKQKNDDHFAVFIGQMDKSLAIQEESVLGIKEAVKRLESAVFILNGKEPK